MKKAFLILACLSLFFSSAWCQSSQNQESPLEIAEPVYEGLEEGPLPVGGMKVLYKAMGKNIKYPRDRTQKRHEGRVVVEFVVTSEGEVINVKVVEGEVKSLNMEAVRVVKLATDLVDWIPGKLNGENVHAKMVLPVTFKLPANGY